MTALYRVNPRKALEVVLWLTERQNPIDINLILKVVYFADKHHLNEHGRPITGDTYDASSHGPVARTIHNLLKGDGLELQALDAYAKGSNDPAPFVVEDRYWIRGLRACDRDALSDSDVEALAAAYALCAGKGFRELERIARDEPAWIDAAIHGRPLRFEDLLDDSSDDRDRKAEDIAEASRHLVF